MVVADRHPGVDTVVEAAAPETAAQSETEIVVHGTFVEPRRGGDIGIFQRQRPEVVRRHRAVGLEEGFQPRRSEVEIEPGERNDIIFTLHEVRGFSFELGPVAVVVGPHVEAHDPACETVAQGGVDQLLAAALQRFLPGPQFVSRFEREPAAAESPGDLRPGPECGLPGLVAVIRPLGVVEEHPPAQGYFKVRAAQVLKIVAETHRDVRIAVVVHPPDPEARTVSVGPGPVTVIHPVVVVNVAFEDVPAEILARGGPDAVEHPRRIVLHPEIVFNIGVPPLVVDVPHDVARRRILRRGVEVQHRVERIPRPGLQVEGQRAVELPVGHRRGADRTRRERRAQRQRRNGVVDFGAHARRVGHVGLDGQFRGALHLRDIGLGHFDLLFDLRRSQLRQHRREGGHYQHLLHRQLSFAIRAFASSTMPSSAGE